MGEKKSYKLKMEIFRLIHKCSHVQMVCAAYREYTLVIQGEPAAANGMKLISGSWG